MNEARKEENTVRDRQSVCRCLSPSSLSLPLSMRPRVKIDRTSDRDTLVKMTVSDSLRFFFLFPSLDPRVNQPTYGPSNHLTNQPVRSQRTTRNTIYFPIRFRLGSARSRNYR